jgi:hypothetical protein
MSDQHARTVHGPADDAGAEAQRGVVKVGTVMVLAMAGVSGLLTLSTAGKGAAVDVGVGVTAFLLFVAAASIGCALGFLFGLPRARLTDQLSVAPAGAGGGDAASASSHYLANSNLIKVSDWLTTIVIGLGLVNLGSAVPALRTLAAALQAPLGGAAYAGAVGISILLGGCIGGFLLVYLYTCIRVRQLLEDSDRQTEHVPYLAGLTVGAAEQVMSGSALRLAVDPDADLESVISTQQPPAGERVPVGSAVAVELRPVAGVNGKVTATTVQAMVSATIPQVVTQSRSEIDSASDALTPTGQLP